MLRRFDKKLNSTKIELFLFAFWLIEQLYYFNKFDGVRIVYDSRRYLAGALHWKIFNPFYSYSAIISPFAHFGFLVGVSILQIFLNLIAFYFFIKIIKHYSSHNIVLLIGGLMFLWPELQLWNLYIHTESIFISISFYILYFYVKQHNKMALLMMITLCFIRPNGFIFLLSYGLIYSFKDLELKKIVTPVFVVMVIMFFIMADFVIPNLNNYPFVWHLTSGFIITGVKTWSVDNSSLDYCRTCTNSFKILSLISYNPVFYIQFWVGRIIILFAQIRPYYPLYHNVIVVILFVPIYISSIGYIIKEKAKNYYFFILPVIFEVIVVLISGVDWDNRYLVIIMPCIFLLSILGLDKFISEDKS